MAVLLNHEARVSASKLYVCYLEAACYCCCLEAVLSLYVSSKPFRGCRVQVSVVLKQMFAASEMREAAGAERLEQEVLAAASKLGPVVKVWSDSRLLSYSNT
jgi:hypothetical protein